MGEPVLGTRRIAFCNSGKGKLLTPACGVDLSGSVFQARRFAKIGSHDAQSVEQVSIARGTKFMYNTSKVKFYIRNSSFKALIQIAGLGDIV